MYVCVALCVALCVYPLMFYYRLKYVYTKVTLLYSYTEVFIVWINWREIPFLFISMNFCRLSSPAFGGATNFRKGSFLFSPFFGDTANYGETNQS